MAKAAPLKQFKTLFCRISRPSSSVSLTIRVAAEWAGTTLGALPPSVMIPCILAEAEMCCLRQFIALKPISIASSALMPAWGGNLSDEEIRALVGYLRELCQCKHGG